ncbi:MAG: cytochrome c oxidase subunit II [Alicyclobacillus sp.]|nr:cytochrome c oxidase subunit II [Alicyclobacillus sp.]
MPNSLASSSWLPPAFTSMAQNVDTLFYIMLGVVTFFFVLVEVLLVVFLIRYRRTKRNQVGYNIHGNNKLEIIWTAIPALILVIMGAYSVHYVYALQTPQPPKYVIKVIGHEWYWEFKYPNGLDTQNVLNLPANENVLFDITSGDVIHGFYIPDVRIQQDAVPGRQTQYWVNIDAKYIGKTFDVPCDQFCGAKHPDMVAHGKVMTDAKFQQWMAAQLKAQQAGS